MRLILILLLIFTTYTHAESTKETGTLYCGTADSSVLGEEDIIISFVNGISNNLQRTENSRKTLVQELLNSDVCESETCIVEKFYNKKDGILFSIDDAQELRFVSNELEGFASRKAFANFITYTKVRYNIYKKLINKINPNEDFKGDDALIEYMDNMRNDFIDGESSQYHVPFSLWGTNIAEGWVDWLKQEFDISSSASYYLSSIVYFNSSDDIYDQFYKNRYESILRITYLSKREFYKDDDNAAQAVTRTVESLVTYLEEHFLAGKKVIVVAHSQGNHMIELAYTVLKEKWGNNVEKSIKVVGVASVASTTPNNTYVTSLNDYTVLGAFDAFQGEPLAGNFELTDGDDNDATNHGFDTVYLNKNLLGYYKPQGGNITEVITGSDQKTNLRDVVIGLIKGSVNAAVASPPEIESGSLLTASLRWEKHDDMDLWTDEPDTDQHVNYNFSEGVYGSLDRDDTDGEGPEHYSLNNDFACSELAEKSWSFGIQQYPDGGNEEIAHFSIKIGNSALASKSYVSNSWPPEIQWIATVSFSEIDSSRKMKFTITLNDGVIEN